MKLAAIKSARKGASSVHLGENTGWSSRPFCGALATGRREVDGTECAHGTVNCRGCIVQAHARFLDFERWIYIGTRVRNLIDAVRAHAVANYDTGAWDIIVEAYTDSELVELVRRCQTTAGAIRKVAKVVEQYRERRAPHDAEIAAATGPRRCTATDECDECLGGSICADRCAHCNGTSSYPCNKHDTPRDRFAEGTHPDGSVVRWHHNADSGDSWARRTWPGKLGEGSIEYRDFEAGSELTEVYRPGWRGFDIWSANYCDHSAPQDEICWSPRCNRPDCCPF